MTNRIAEVTQFVENYIYHNSVFVEATEEQQFRAINHCELLLVKRLSKYFKEIKDIPLDILSHQVVWLMQIDDTFIRADMGATYVQMAGVMVTIKDKDRSIAPYVLQSLGITEADLNRRKVARYVDRVVGTPYSNLRG